MLNVSVYLQSSYSEPQNPVIWSSRKQSEWGMWIQLASRPQDPHVNQYKHWRVFWIKKYLHHLFIKSLLLGMPGSLNIYFTELRLIIYNVPRQIEAIYCLTFSRTPLLSDTKTINTCLVRNSLSGFLFFWYKLHFHIARKRHGTFQIIISFLSDRDFHRTLFCPIL